MKVIRVVEVILLRVPFSLYTSHNESVKTTGALLMVLLVLLLVLLVLFVSLLVLVEVLLVVLVLG